MADETVIQRQDGATIKIQMKRGSGTNDRDKIKGTVHGENIDDARQKASEMKTELETLMEQIRNVQPDEDEE